MIRIALVIPSYNRKSVLIEAIESLRKNMHRQLLERFSIDITPCLYIQGATEEEKSEYVVKLGGWAKFEFVPKYTKPVIGAINKDALLSFVSELDRSQFFMLCDDDFLVRESTQDELERFYMMINHMTTNKVVVGSAKLKNPKNFKARPWPQLNKQEFSPFKERFIIFGNYHEDYKLGKIFTHDFDKLTVGEDAYIFLKALALKYSIVEYYGLGFYQQPQLEDDHPRHAEYNSRMTGGFIDLVSEVTGKTFKKHQQKYDAIKSATSGSVQERYADFFHYDSAFSNGRRLRPDLIQYIDSNIRFDGSNNIVRVNGAKVMEYDGSDRPIPGLKRTLKHFEHVFSREVPL